MALRRCPRKRQRHGEPYAEGKNTGSAIFCANRRARGGYITALTHRDPSGLLLVVIGASHASSFATATGRSAASRSSSVTGNHRRSGAGTRRADSSANERVV